MSSSYFRRSQKHKKDRQVIIVFLFLGSECVKAARLTLVKLTPGQIKKKVIVGQFKTQMNKHSILFLVWSERFL